MLVDGINHYIELRQSLGYKLREQKLVLHSFAKFLEKCGETHITSKNAEAWSNLAPSPYARDRRMRHIVMLARFLKFEDPVHEIPSRELFKHQYVRPLPYIYSKEEILELMTEAGKLRRQPNANPLRPEVFVTVLGLITATGLRISEALKLKLGDIGEDGVLFIRQTKFGKSRKSPTCPVLTG